MIDISDKVWAVIAPLLPGRKAGRGRIAEDNRKFINAVFRILRTGVPWRDLPPEYGGWKNTHRRFTRWRDNGIWQLIFEILLQQVGLQEELEWAMIDAKFIKCHMSACGAKGGNQEMAKSKGGINTKIHIAVDEFGNPRKFILTDGIIADCTKATELR